MRAKSAGRHANYLGLAVLIDFLFGVSCAAQAAEANPLRPADTTSPRATLQGFIYSTDDVYIQMKDVLEDCRRSDRLYLNQEERRNSWPPTQMRPRSFAS